MLNGSCAIQPDSRDFRKPLVAERTSNPLALAENKTRLTESRRFGFGLFASRSIAEQGADFSRLLRSIVGRLLTYSSIRRLRALHWRR